MGGKRRSKKRKMRMRPEGLRVIHDACAGIDLGAKEHWVCCPPREDGEPNVKTFGTTTPQLEALADFLAREGITSVAMESTGVYWIPIFELLEERGFEVVLVDARKLSGVPGRKTDMLDCQWLQQLHSCGLLTGAFRPPEDICEFRALVREKANVVQARADWIRRMQKCLDQMNVQVHRAVTDLTGKTGMSIIRAIVNGERDPMVLAALRDRRCRNTQEQIAEHLKGNWREEHLFNLDQALYMYDTMTEVISRYELRIIECVRALKSTHSEDQQPPELPNDSHAPTAKKKPAPDRDALAEMAGCDLCLIDGIGVETAYAVLSEFGTDLTCFPTENHFVSYIRLAPHTPITGGKPIKKKKRKGSTSTRVADALRMAALSLKHSQSALGAYYRRLAFRKGPSIAIFATARKLAKLIYRMLRYGVQYFDEGAKAYQQRFRQRRITSLHNSAKELGFRLIPSTS